MSSSLWFTNASLRSRLDDMIQKRSLLGHSFYQRWQAGTLTRAELQGYAKEYYSFEREFPRFLSAIHSRCEDASLRKLLLENLVHEEQGEESHPELWLRFAEGMGTTREAVTTHFHSDETEHLLRVYRKHATSSNPIDGLAALYAYERQQPEVAKQKREGLKKNYGITDESTVRFFDAHETYDVGHSESEMTCLSELCATREDEDRAALAAGEALDALCEFLDGVERRYGQAAA